MRTLSRRTGLIVTGVLCLTFAVICSIGVAAIQHQIIAGPEINIHLGSLRILGGTTDNPACPLGAMPCPLISTRPGQKFYTIWGLTVTEERGGLQTSVRNVVSLPLSP